MAATVVLVTEALEVVNQLIPVIQKAVANGQTTIDGATWADAIQVRDKDLAALDAAIKAAPDPKA